MSKSLGQIAHEARGGSWFMKPIPWDELPQHRKDDCERMARAAVAHAEARLSKAIELLKESRDYVASEVALNKSQWGERLQHKQKIAIGDLAAIDAFLREAGHE